MATPTLDPVVVYGSWPPTPPTWGPFGVWDWYWDWYRECGGDWYGRWMTWTKLKTTSHPALPLIRPRLSLHLNRLLRL